MDSTLAGFVRALRGAGAEASTAETIDAARAMALLGYADRDNLKAALTVALGKSADEQAIVAKVFDQFFSLPNTPAQRPSAADAAHQSAVEEGPPEQPNPPSDDANDQPPARGGGGGPGESARGGRPGQRQPGGEGAQDTDPADQAAINRLLALADGAARGGEAADPLRIALARAAAAAGVDEIRFATQAAYFTRRLLDQLGTAPLDARLLTLLSRSDPEGQAQAARLSTARATLQRQARALVDQRFELFGRPATEAFMTEVVVNRAMGRLAPADMARMKAAVARMARRLAQRHSHRQRIKLHGQLDFRRTLRANAGQDSVPINLHFKHKRRDKPRIVVVCDVSGSVAPVVRFLLLFLYALQGTVTDLRCFAFSNHLRDVSGPLESLPFDDAMALILKEVGGGGTDYGQAWEDLHEHHWDCIDGRTTVLVLGDGRSNQADPRLDLFAELSQRAKRVVWLCPEPPGRWGSGDSCMLQYRPLASHTAYCASAADLERVIDEALAAYG